MLARKGTETVVGTGESFHTKSLMVLAPTALIRREKASMSSTNTRIEGIVTVESRPGQWW